MKFEILPNGAIINLPFSESFLFDFSAFKNKANWETGYFTYNYSSEGQEYEWIIRADC